MRTLGKTLVLLAALPAAVASCGDDAGAVDYDQFLGSWMLAETRTTKGCGNRPPEMATGTLFVTKASEGYLLFAINPTCILKADAAGATATLRAGEMCTSMFGQVMGNVTVQGGTFTVDGITASFSYNGKVSVTIASVGLMCDFASMGTATKVQ